MATKERKKPESNADMADKTQQELKREIVIANLEDYFTLDMLCGKCKRLKRLKALYSEGKLEADLWEKVMLLLIGMGYVAHAKEFTKLASKATAEQHRFIDDVSLNRNIDTTVYCEELGCVAKQIKQCFNEDYDTTQGYSPAFNVLTLTEDMKKKLGFIYISPKKAKKDKDKDNDDDSEEDNNDNDEGYPDEETGIVFKEIEYNIFTKYVLLNYDIMLHTVGEFYIYENNYWKPISDARLKRVLRRFFLKYELNWTPSIEKIYMSTLGYDCLELAELKIKEAEKYINLRNGLLNIKTFKMEPHDKEVFSTIQISIDYDPEKEFNAEEDCPKFTKFLGSIFNEDEATINYIQEVMGYCLSNSVEAHKMWFFLGGGSNGKSVLCDVLTDLVGGIENISTVSLSRFNSQFALAHIKDKTINIATENEIKTTLDTQAIKAISSGDPIQIEEKFKTPLSYAPRTKLIFSLNTMPKIKDLSVGLGRRLDIVPFNIRFVRNPKYPNERKLIPNIKRRLQKEREGIFAFAIEGLKRLLKHKYEFSECPAVEEQREKIRKPNTLCDGFVSACLDVDDANDWVNKQKKNNKTVLVSSNETRSTTDDLFASFIGWCLKNEHEKEAKTMDMSGFLSGFRTSLRNNYDFQLAEGEKSKCENEEKSNNMNYFNCVALNDTGNEYVASGQRFIEQHNLRNKKTESAKSS